MNRRQRRAFKTKFRRMDIESVPMPRGVDLVVHEGGKVERVIVPCDWLGCTSEWLFSTMANVDGKRKVVERRCAEHRLSRPTG